MIDRESFAKWLQESDVKAFAPELAPFDFPEYQEEADFYLTLKPDEWPCYILGKAGKHEEFHGPSCQPDPLL